MRRRPLCQEGGVGTSRDLSVMGRGDGSREGTVMNLRPHAPGPAIPVVGAGVALRGAGQTSRAPLVTADASATCRGGSTSAPIASTTPSASGASEVLGLTVNGQTIAVTGAPNQTVTVAGLTLIINEQSWNG